MRILLANFAKMVNDSGGLAKVNVAFANEMVQRGHQVATIYSDDRVGIPFYPFDKDVEVYNLRQYRGQEIRFPIYYKIKREILRAIDVKWGRAVNDEFIEKYLLENVKDIFDTFRPDVIVCFQPASAKSFLCDLNTSIPVITMSHGDPEDYFHTYPDVELPALEKSSVCQVLMPSFEQAIKKRYPNVRTAVIGNVVPQYIEQAQLDRKKEEYRIVFVGRLVKNHKRPHLLIDAFSRIADQFPDWKVELWGDNDNARYTKSLKEMIKKEKLEDRILLKGATHNVAAVLKQADLFVLPSAYEGFGLSIAEGMSMGLPAIAYKNCAAVNELIKDGVTGCLCDDGAEALSKKMAYLMSNRNMRVDMGNSARQAMKNYASERIWRDWESLFKTIVAN